jgi:tetratricopeptide (TPR) repeat protein
VPPRFAEGGGGCRLSPSDAYVVRNYARVQAEIGRGDAAVSAASRYGALDPLAANSAGALGAILFRAGRLDAAIAMLRQPLVRLPGDREAGFDLGIALLTAGRTAEALTQAQSMPLDGRQSLAVRAIALARLGNRASEGVVDRAGPDAALDRPRRLDTAWYQVAEVSAQRGAIDDAFAALGRAEAMVDPGLVEVKVDPMLSPLHDDPRYVAMIRRIGFP